VFDCLHVYIFMHLVHRVCCVYQCYVILFYIIWYVIVLVCIVLCAEANYYMKQLSCSSNYFFIFTKDRMDFFIVWLL